MGRPPYRQGKRAHMRSCQRPTSTRFDFKPGGTRIVSHEDELRALRQQQRNQAAFAVGAAVGAIVSARREANRDAVLAAEQEAQAAAEALYHAEEEQRRHRELVEQQDRHGYAMWLATPFGQQWRALLASVTPAIEAIGGRDHQWRRAWFEYAADHEVSLSMEMADRADEEAKHADAVDERFAIIKLGFVVVGGLIALNIVLHLLNHSFFADPHGGELGVRGERSFLLNKTMSVASLGAVATIVGSAVFIRKRDSHREAARRHRAKQSETEQSFRARWLELTGFDLGSSFDPCQSAPWTYYNNSAVVVDNIRRLSEKHYTNVVPEDLDELRTWLYGGTRIDRPEDWPAEVRKLLDAWNAEERG